MKSVKLTFASSLLAISMAGALVGCTAEVTPNEPDTTFVRPAPAPDHGGATNNAGNEQRVTTTGVKNAAPLTPWGEPVPNPWKQGPDDGTIPGPGDVPGVQTPDDTLPSPRPTVHHPVDGSGDHETYHGPTGRNAF